MKLHVFAKKSQSDFAKNNFISNENGDENFDGAPP